METGSEDFIFNTDFALTVLNFYNYKNTTDFELVEALGEMGLLHSRHAKIGSLFHCSFKARSSTTSVDGDSSPKIFHAELFEDKYDRMIIVMFCHILQDNNTGCEICDNKIFGSYRYSHRILQPPSTPLWLSTDKAEKDNTGIAKLALEHYNKSHDTNYEFLRYEAINTSIDLKMISHTNFYAKPKGVVDNRSSSTKRFFAEWEQTYAGAVINFCCILEGDLLTEGDYATGSKTPKIVKDGGEADVPCFRCETRCKDVLHPLWGNWCRGSDERELMYSETDEEEEETQDESRKSDDSHRKNILPRCAVVAAGEEENADTSPISVVMCPADEDFNFIPDFALTVLNFYNYKNRTDFELVDALGEMGLLHSRHVLIGSLFHCSFKARSSTTSVDGDSSPKIFHAELFEDNNDRMLVYFCNILHDNNTGCEICDSKLFGAYRYSPNRILQPPRTPLWLRTDKDEWDESGIAKKALEQYNKSYHTEYEFLRYEGTSLVLDRRMISHVNFFAKPKAASDNRSLSKLFFAEWEQIPGGELISFCCILEGETNVPCFLCKPRGNEVLHPLWGDWYGRPKVERQRGRHGRRGRCPSKACR